MTTAARHDGPGEASTLAAVRAATRDLHRALEADVDVDRVFATPAAYRGFLAQLHGFHAAWEPHLAAAGHLVPELLPLPPRAARLADDLRALDAADADSSAAAGNRASGTSTATAAGSAAPPLASPAYAAGVLYVIEGSALGGAVLARLARKRLGIEPATGSSFFTGEEGLAARWRLVAAEIDRHAPVEVIIGVVDIFGHMRAALVPTRRDS